jgi:hypothetical protein
MTPHGREMDVLDIGLVLSHAVVFRWVSLLAMDGWNIDRVVIAAPIDEDLCSNLTIGCKEIMPLRDSRRFRMSRVVIAQKNGRSGTRSPTYLFLVDFAKVLQG